MTMTDQPRLTDPAAVVAWWADKAAEDRHPDRRAATPDDPTCSCGLPALVVYTTEKFGDVASCR